MDETQKNLKGLQEKFENLVFDEVKFGIVTALKLYDSLNLKKLAQLVDKPETTTIRYVKALLNEGLIDVDAEKTATSWGKFYKLSKEAYIIIREHDKKLEDKEKGVFQELLEYKNKTEEEITKATLKQILAKTDSEKLIASIKNSLASKHNIENTITNEFIASIVKLNRLITEKGKEYLEENLLIAPSDIIMYGTSVKIVKSKHLLKIYELFLEFFNDLKELKNSLEKEMLEENIPDDQKRIMNIQFFSGTMDFKFSLKDQL